MEPDLDRLLDFESGGSLFPQFKDRWAAVFADAQKVKEAVLGAGSGRPRVALVTADPISFCALFIALCRSGIDLFLFNPKWGRQEMEQALAVAQPEWKAGDYGWSGLSLERVRGAPARAQLATGKLRVMIATGGTTGGVRFAIHDWSTLAASSYGFAQHLSCESVASHCVLPLYHVSGFMQLTRSLLTMGTIVFGSLEDFAKSHALIVAAPSGARVLSLVATQLERLLRDSENAGRLREYRAVFLGGGPAPAALLEDCRELRLPIALTYGMTETAAQVATLLPEKFLKGEASQGRPLAHARIDIVAEDDSRQLLPRGERGRIRIFGTSVFKGYYGETDTVESRMIVTSDVGYLCDDGKLCVEGRADRVIISGGEKIDLREVEQLVEKSSLTRDVVAFGVPDVEWGQKLALAYVPKESFVSETALRESARGELAGYKMPKLWIRLDELPRSEAGKPLVARLVELAKGAKV